MRRHFRSDAQRRAMFAAMAGHAPRHGAIRRAALGAAVAAGAIGVGIAGRRSPLIRRLALRTGLAGAGSAAYEALRAHAAHHTDRAKRWARMPGDYASKRVAAGRLLGRTFPVDILAAKGVDKGFHLLESGIHAHLAHRVQRVEEIAGAKLGAAQSLVSAHAATRLARLQRARFGAAATDAELRARADWVHRLKKPDLAALTKGRTLRRGADVKVELAKARLWAELTKRGLLRHAAAGLIDPATLREAARGAGIGEHDTNRLRQVSHGIQADALFGTGV